MTDQPVAADWMGLRWSAWMPLLAAHPLALAQLPSERGLYRIRRADRPSRLVWIAWEPRGVRETMERLSRQVHMPVEPYDDPASPARMLWSLQRTVNSHLEVSGAALEVEEAEGRAREEQLRVAYERAVCGVE